MTIEKITPAFCKKVRPELDAALVGVAKKYGLTITAGNGSYDDTSVTFKVQLVLDGVDKGKEEFDRVAFLFDLKPEDYGREITSRGRKYKLVGLKPNRPKYPVIGERDGKRYKLTDAPIKFLKNWEQQ